MRLGIDADPIGRNRSGNENYLRGIVAGLQRTIGPNDRLLLAGSDVVALADLLDPATYLVPIRPGIVGDLSLGVLLHRRGATVALGHYNAPLGFRGPRATVIHDVAFERLPQTFPAPLRARLAWSVRRSVRVSDLVVTVSQFSKRELCSVYPRLSAERVVVTYDAPGPAFGAERTPEALAEVKKRYALPDSFVLGVGNVQPRKNLSRLAEAMSRIDAPLVLAGQPLWRHKEDLAMFKSQGTQWLGYVPTHDLACLYRLCAVFAYPSLYEGFGLPVIEAMASGAPVVTSATSALPEVAGGAAVLVDPTEVDEIERGVVRLLADREGADRLAERGRARAEQFSWDASASTLIDALRRIS